MLESNASARRTLAALSVVCCVPLICGITSPAVAQALDTYRMLPLPDGTNAIEAEGAYTYDNAFHFSNGQKVPNTNLDSYGAAVRYSHYFAVDGHTLALEVIQPISYAANWQFNGYNNNGASGMRSLGAGNTTLAAMFWPYANPALQAYVFTAAYVGLPDGSYSQTNSVNSAYGGWQGDAQIGAVKGFGPNLSLEGAIDANFLGNEQLGYGAERSIDPVYRIQIWGNWDWGNNLRTSVGYTGMFGGAWSTVYANATYAVPRNAERQQVRAAVSYWWNPAILTSIEVDHDVEVGGGYQLGIGAEGKLKLLF